MAEWKVESLFVGQTADHANVVTHVAWACEGNNPRLGKLTLDPPGQLFTAYSDLTEQRVLAWVWEKLDKAAIEASVDAPVPQLSSEALKPLHLPSAVKALPWSN
jgi:hypothetical protein